MEINVFSFSNPREFLNWTLQEKRTANPNFSLRSWSRHLGLSTPSILSRTLNGQRSMTLDLATRFADGLDLSDLERRYFKLLVLLSNAKTLEEKELYSDLMHNIVPNKGISFIDLDEFQSLSKWYHIAILEMLELKNFNNDPQWISEQLLVEISESEVSDAIDRLIRMGLVKKTPKNKLTRVIEKTLMFGDSESNEALKKYHNQILSMAKNAVTAQAYDERHLRASTISIKNDNLEEAKKIIKLCHKNLNKLSAEGDGDLVYIASTQFFKITKGNSNEN